MAGLLLPTYIHLTIARCLKIALFVNILSFLSVATLVAQPNTITGKVFIDPNLTGTYEPTDFGQPAIRVYLYQDMNSSGTVDGGDILLDTQLSDAVGDFTFTATSGNSLSVRVSTGNDDAEERLSNGAVTRNSSDLELIRDGSRNQIVGMRFRNITVPPGATITNAYIDFECDESDSGPTNLTISGQDVDNAPGFTTAAYNISSRTQTTASVAWNSIPSWSVNGNYQTPDLSTVIQEIVDRPGWSSGNSMVILVEGSGQRVAESYNGESWNAPLFYVEYAVGSNDYVMEIEMADIPPAATLTTDNVETATFSGSGEVDSLNYFGYDGESVSCWGVSDINNAAGIDELMLINRFSGANVLINPIGTFNTESIALGIGGDPLYAANSNRLGTLDKATGVYTPAPNPFGTGWGALGNVTFSDVDGLSFDPFTGILYGSSRRNGGGNMDVLLQIDPVTGQHINNAFGSGNDYVPITGPGLLDDIDDIAIDPTDGTMYGVSNNGGTNDYLVTIDKATGIGTVVGLLSVWDMEGLSFHNNGTLYGMTGNNSSSGNDDKLFMINKTTGLATEIGPFSTGHDYESCACLTNPPNLITGTVFEDANWSAVLDPAEIGIDSVTVFLYTDENSNGIVDPADVLIQTKEVDVNGYYSFQVGVAGDFVINIDTTDIPVGYSLTTDNIETANFPGLGMIDANNDFGAFGAVLPIELVFFKAEPIGNHVKLTWVTAAEVNNDFFTLENTTDALSFNTVTTVEGAGNSHSMIEYTYIDENPIAGASYYRLKQTDYDGNYEYSKLVSVQIDQPETYDFAVYPNPAIDNDIFISFEDYKDKELMVALCDPMGKVVFSKIVLTEEDGSVYIAQDNMVNLNPGIYLVIGSSENKLYNKKLVIGKNNADQPFNLRILAYRD